MKKIIYLFTALLMIAFASCDPLEDAYTELDEAAKPYTDDITITLASADYRLLPTTAGVSRNGYFVSTDDAKIQIATILNSKYPQLGNGSTAAVTYTTGPNTPVADSLFNNLTYIVTDAEYAAVNGTTFKNFSPAKVLEFLAYKYPNPAPNKLVVLTYTYWESGVTPSAGIANTVESYYFVDGAWTKAFHITPALFTSVGRGSFGNFSSIDLPNLPAFFNSFLKADATVMSTAKVGTVKYVSYKYFASPTNYQKIMKMTYDGTNWVARQGTLSFVKKDGSWIADPTIRYTLARADYNTIGDNALIGTTENRANLKSFGNFYQVGNGTDTRYWTDAQIQAGLAALVKAKYPNAETGQQVILTFIKYTGSNTTVVWTFEKKDSGNYEYVPQP